MASKPRPRPPFECIALLLQCGGALGAYQAGVYEALTEADLHPDRIAGISIGAINGALIAGNAPKARVDKLRAFWESVTANPCCDWSERLFLAKGRCRAGVVEPDERQSRSGAWRRQGWMRVAMVSSSPGLKKCSVGKGASAVGALSFNYKGRSSL